MRRKSRRPRLFRIAAAVLLGAAVVGAGGARLPLIVSSPPDPPAEIDNRAITEAGCCSGFSWSDDGDDVTFFDRDLDGRQGLWALDTTTLEKTFESPAPRLTSPSGRYQIEQTGTPNSAILTDTLLDETWEFSLAGPYLLFSPLEDRVLFSVRQPGILPNYARLASIYTASVDGSDVRLLTRMFGGPIGWFPDGERVLLSGRQTLDEPSGIWIYNLSSSELKQIVTGDFIRRTSISPGGAVRCICSFIDGRPVRLRSLAPRNRQRDQPSDCRSGQLSLASERPGVAGNSTAPRRGRRSFDLVDRYCEPRNRRAYRKWTGRLTDLELRVAVIPGRPPGGLPAHRQSQPLDRGLR